MKNEIKSKKKRKLGTLLNFRILKSTIKINCYKIEKCYCSVVVCISLARIGIDDNVAFNESLVRLTFHSFDWRPI